MRDFGDCGDQQGIRRREAAIVEDIALPYHGAQQHAVIRYPDGF
jgi:hypothetical protein